MNQMLKTTVAFTAALLVLVGALSMGGGLVASIIYTIYNWAHEMPLAQALWEGAVLWMKMLGGGIIAVLIGIGMGGASR